VRGIAAGMMGGDGANIAILEEILGGADFGFWDVIDWEFRDLSFDFAHRLDESGIGAEVAVAFPLDGHFADFAAEADCAGNFRGDVGGVAAALVIVENLFEMMHPAEVVSSAGAIPITFDFHHVEEVGGFVGAGFVMKHASKGQGVFVVSPAIHAREVGYRRLDAVMDFEREVDIRDADHFARHSHGALAERQATPIFTFRFGDDGEKLGFAMEDLV